MTAATAPAWRNRIVGQGEVAPADLVPNAKNWRTHPKGQVDALEGALAEVGWVQQVIVNRTTGRLVDGHARVASALRRKEPAVPVLYVELTEAEEGLVLASLDPIGALAGTDQAALDSLLADVTVDDDALRAMLGDLASVARISAADPDSSPEVPEQPWVKPGDLFELGRHRILCGSSSDPIDVDRLLGETTVALIATDPPYGVDYAGVVAGRANQKKGGWAAIEGDQGVDGADLTGKALTLARGHAEPGCAVLVWHPTGANAAAFRAALVAAGVHILKQIIWVKPTLVFGRHEYHWRHETAMYGWFEGHRARFFGDRASTTVWEVAPSPGFQVRNGPAMAGGGLGLHPTQKPVELYEIPLINHTLPGEALYEPFVGSGSGLIAAEKSNRRCFAIDVDPRYVQVVIERWQAYTGREAVRVDA